MSALTSIQLPDDLIEAARQDAALHSRSVSAQLEHWARMGQALEAVPGFSLERVRAALNGRLASSALCDDELRIMEDLLFVDPTQAQQQAMARIGTRAGAVGLSDDGHMVRVRADGSTEVLPE